MGCSHAQECPLFPLLNASLRDWRNYYCDSAEGWRTCARYQLSRTGRLVPITLLPNGVDASHLRRDPAADGWDTASQPSPSRPSPGSSQRFEPVPAREPNPVPATAQGFNTGSPAQGPHPSSTPSTPPASRRARWWTRLAEWIAGPA
ncbi:hypothetical protein GA0074695_2658 [Micromonospora viridifaciens]|uniref:Uncharacterized protein n=1 Tax=Micromonospora viridifaciens TaxID=1881 RepID=A0A1C4WQT4_MICVI|nr:hypothetical protein GA0074695_2658 [Micromonospora viridifaciens]